MKKTISLGVIFLFVMVSFTSISGNQINNHIFKTSSRGNIMYVGGSGPGNYSRIQDAINDSSDGDTVFVFDDSSPYYETVVIDKSINLIGEEKDITTIDGGEHGSVVSIFADWVNVSGFTIRNCEQSIFYEGVHIRGYNNTVSGNIIINNSYGIFLSDESNNVCFNDIKNNWYGIALSGESNNVSSNNIINNLYGILIYGGDYNNIINNIITNNKESGIGSIAGFSNIIAFNTITKNVNGIDFFDFTDYNIISCNVISNNTGCGIILRYQDSNTIIGNNITNNSYGIYLDGSLYNKIINNTVTNNYYGLYLESESNNNKIYHNNFLGNDPNALVEDECINTWDNGYPSGGNFWDDYDGTDADGDGIGDSPYPIPRGDNTDRYPLGNFRPDTPTITGPTNGKPCVDYNYTFVSTDPEGDNLIYLISWDEYFIWVYGPYPSGEEITISHKWDEEGIYLIKCMTVDIHDAGSNTTAFEVTIPRNKAVTSNMFLLRILERFPLLERLYYLIRI